MHPRHMICEETLSLYFPFVQVFNLQDIVLLKINAQHCRAAQFSVLKSVEVCKVDRGETNKKKEAPAPFFCL